VLNDLSRSLTRFDPTQTLIAVVEMGKSSWLVGLDAEPFRGPRNVTFLGNRNEIAELSQLHSHTSQVYILFLS
jgi:hypothetical protein